MTCHEQTGILKQVRDDKLWKCAQAKACYSNARGLKVRYSDTNRTYQQGIKIFAPYVMRNKYFCSLHNARGTVLDRSLQMRAG